MQRGAVLSCNHSLSPSLPKHHALPQSIKCLPSVLFHHIQTSTVPARPSSRHERQKNNSNKRRKRKETDLYSVVPVEQNVLQLQVAMDDALLQNKTEPALNTIVIKEQHCHASNEWDLATAAAETHPRYNNKLEQKKKHCHPFTMSSLPLPQYRAFPSLNFNFQTASKRIWQRDKQPLPPWTATARFANSLCYSVKFKRVEKAEWEVEAR